MTAPSPSRTVTAEFRPAATVIGTNVVIDYGTHEAAMAALDALPVSPTDGLDAALKRVATMGCVRMLWGARRPCDEYTDGREHCSPCAVRVALATSTEEPRA